MKNKILSIFMSITLGNIHSTKDHRRLAEEASARRAFADNFLLTLFPGPLYPKARFPRVERQK